MLKLKRLFGTFVGCLLAAIVFNSAIAGNNEPLGGVGGNDRVIGAQDSEQIRVPLNVR